MEKDENRLGMPHRAHERITYIYIYIYIYTYVCVCVCVREREREKVVVVVAVVVGVGGVVAERCWWCEGFGCRRPWLDRE